MSSPLSGTVSIQHFQGSWIPFSINGKHVFRLLCLSLLSQRQQCAKLYFYLKKVDEPDKPKAVFRRKLKRPAERTCFLSHLHRLWGVCHRELDPNPSPVYTPSAPPSPCSRLLMSKLEPLVEVSPLPCPSSGGVKRSSSFNLIWTAPCAHWVIWSFLGLVMPEAMQNLSQSHNHHPVPCHDSW